MKGFILKKLPFLISILLSAQSVCANSCTFPLPPRLTLWGSWGNNTFGVADAMVPVWGDPGQILYLDAAGKHGDDNAWFLGAGLGGRKIFFNNLLLGAYIFGENNKTPNAKYFTVLNPGIEFMTNEWDGHLNGYFPVSENDKLLAILTGNQIGIIDPTFFRGHAQYASLFDLIESVGNGGDLEIGYTFNCFMNARVFAGGYFFYPKYRSNINGVEAGFQIPLKYKWASIDVRDSYDNLNHNTFLISLQINIGGIDKSCQIGIQNRMLDVIPRHLADLSDGDGIPSERNVVNKGRFVLIQDNLWFFNPGSPIPNNPTLVAPPTLVSTPPMFTKIASTATTLPPAPDQPVTFQNCTFEHPCVGLSQIKIDSINAISPNANFYLSPGTYNNPDVGQAFSFHNGQNVFGRTANFRSLAVGNDRPLLNDSLYLEGNNNVYNLRVNGQSIRNLSTGGDVFPFQVGGLIRSFATGTINIYNSEFTSIQNDQVIALANNSNSSTVNVFNSTLFSDSKNLPINTTIGLGNLRSGSINMDNSSIIVASKGVAGFNVVVGVVNNEAGPVNINNSSISVSSTNGGICGGVSNNSTLGLGFGTVSINHSNVDVQTDNTFLTAAILNQGNNPQMVSGHININDSLISATSFGGSETSGVVSSGTGATNIANSTVIASGNNGNISGIAVGDPQSTVNIVNNTIESNATDTGTATPILNNGTLNDLGGNQCFQNGKLVPCQ